jgi:Putative beta-barrel porin 2
MGGIRTKLFGWAAFVAVALIGGAVQHSFAQEIAPGGQYKEGIDAGGVILYPRLFVGAVYNDNINQSPSVLQTPLGPEQRSSDYGARVVPGFTAVYDGGIHKSTVYGVADAQFFNGNTVAATTGFTHLYEAMRDLVFALQGNFTRQTDLFNNALNFNNGAIGPNISGSPEVNIPIILNPFGTTPSVNPTAYNQFTGSASVLKNFNDAFVTLTGTAFHITFDKLDNLPVPDPFQTNQDGTSYWATGRIGYNVTPQFYVFAEGSGIFQRFSKSLFDTNGYRVTGGFGSRDPQSLFRGEIYGGYQAQSLVQGDANTVGVPLNLNGVPTNVVGLGIPSDVHSGIFGGRLIYNPTKYWSLVAAVDQTLGISPIQSLSIPAGTPILATNAILQANYKLSPWWWVGVRGGYTQSRSFGVPQSQFFGFLPFNNGSRLDNGWLAGASFNYEILRNLGLTLDYQYTTVHSNVTFSDFTRHVYTAGLTYKY